jgi:hypothetical protein
MAKPDLGACRYFDTCPYFDRLYGLSNTGRWERQAQEKHPFNTLHKADQKISLASVLA